MGNYDSTPLWGGIADYVKTCSECGAVVPWGNHALHDKWHSTLRPEIDNTPKCPYTHSHTQNFCGYSTCREN